MIALVERRGYRRTDSTLSGRLYHPLAQQADENTPQPAASHSIGIAIALSPAV